jgi:hypothetical protein
MNGIFTPKKESVRLQEKGKNIDDLLNAISEYELRHGIK